MTDQYAVIGHPISHSKSPLIHEAFARQTGQDIRYEKLLAPLDGFAEMVHSLKAKGYMGANVTVPFKFEALAICSELSERAEAAGAVNTLIFSQNAIRGDNTDGIGLVNDVLYNLQVEIKDKRVLLLGAGGAAQGVLLPLLQQQPAQLTIANRQVDKAHFMMQKIASQFSIQNVSVCEYSVLNQPFDMVINATSAGLTNAALPISMDVFSKHTLAYDMMYGKETPFMVQAASQGARVADGLGMLVEQAAEAFYLWRGVRPLTAPVIAVIRAL